MALSKQVKAEIVKKYGKNEKDTGSVQVQVALLTEQIKALTAHLQKNHKVHPNEQPFYGIQYNQLTSPLKQ